MVKGILGRKVGMTQLFDESGTAIPVTVIQAGPCHVLQIRSLERDGYTAVQLGYLDKKRPRGKRIRPSQASRAERGHVADIGSARSRRLREAGVEIPPKANCEPKRFIRELRGDTTGYEVGQVITVSDLADVAAVDVTGTSKGRGYSGVMKRHGFAGLRASHGTKKVHRHMGTTGGLAAWRGGGRPKKGKKMPGQYGNCRVTVRNLKVVKIDPERHLLVVRGAVPGPNGGFVIVRQTNKVG
ncbi:MAG: 50S ribosomal protein L3 [Pirellulaceae bacterium]|nr:MAG: 50S ribosomal protein L3 [Pirellulaceae bacterium]GIW94640.1 MAG: 50S ribosomal protein L3 [Pirellulaceae bacterium]